jgi:PAS domain S-box-containing protein
MAPDLVGIIMTGQGTIQTAVEAMRIGAFDYVLKPVTLAALLPMLARAMEVRRLRAARRTLEAQVQEHTAALLHTNETLRHEIAERQRAEAALRREEEYFRALIEHALDIVGLLNEDGTVRYFSPALTQVLGYQPVELLGTPLTTLIHPDDLPGLQDTLPHFLSTPGATTHLEYRALHKDGAFRTLEVVGNNLLLNPAVAGIVINARDITERQEAARLKDDLLAVVSHELRTPLTSLRGFTELLLTRVLPADKQQHFLTIIHDETIRLSHLITDFLDLQRMQAGRQVYRLTRTDLAVMLREMVSVFTPESGAHVMRVEVSDALPVVYADAERLRQVLANLLSNAIKFSPHGGEVTVGARAQDTQVLVWVADHGLGIPPEALPRLFNKFYRVEHHETRHIGGTGLGLALVKEIVEAHHGSVWVESVLGQGSTFFFTVSVAVLGHHAPARDDTPSAMAHQI